MLTPPLEKMFVKIADWHCYCERGHQERKQCWKADRQLPSASRKTKHHCWTLLRERKKPMHRSKQKTHDTESNKAKERKLTVDWYRRCSSVALQKEQGRETTTTTTMTTTTTTTIYCHSLFFPNSFGSGKWAVITVQSGLAICKYLQVFPPPPLQKKWKKWPNDQPSLFSMSRKSSRLPAFPQTDCMKKKGKHKQEKRFSNATVKGSPTSLLKKQKDKTAKKKKQPNLCPPPPPPPQKKPPP